MSFILRTLLWRINDDDDDDDDDDDLLYNMFYTENPQQFAGQVHKNRSLAAN